MYHIIVAIIVTVVAASPVIAQDVVRHADLTYSQAGDVELKLNLTRPAGDGPFPVVVFIHGGGWYLGNRLGYKSETQEANSRGYAAVTISYRLMTFDESQKETTTADTIFPAQIHDAKAAIRWLRANADLYHLDPDRIGVTGRSAGGHLSLLLGLTDPASDLEGAGGHPEQSSRVQAVVNVFGPTDLRACYETSSVSWIFRLFMGGTPTESAETYRIASPLTWVSADDPPVLTLHGSEDKAVPFTQAKKLDERMKSAGASHTLIEFAGQGHGFGGEFRRRELDAMWHFFEMHLRP
ncbi:MAG: alpha/beta hydrolase [Planctomycetaceae bacterium]